MSSKTIRFISLMIACSLLLSLSGCLFESKELKRIKSVAFHFRYTREDCDFLRENQNTKEVQRWLEETAVKIRNGEYSKTNIASLTDCLESSDVHHPEVEKQTRFFYAEIMKEEYAGLIQEVISDIDSIGAMESLTLEDCSRVSEIVRKCDEIPDEILDLVTNHSKLLAAADKCKQIREATWIDCSRCNGTKKEKCINCNGSGTVKYYYGSSDLEAVLSGHDPYSYGPCTMCDEKGYYRCELCDGKGGHYPS